MRISGHLGSCRWRALWTRWSGPCRFSVWRPEAPSSPRSPPAGLCSGWWSETTPACRPRQRSGGTDWFVRTCRDLLGLQRRKMNHRLTSIQFLCLCCSFPFRRGPIMLLTSGWSVSITRFARICTQVKLFIYWLHFMAAFRTSACLSINT